MTIRCRNVIFLVAGMLVLAAALCHAYRHYWLGARSPKVPRFHLAYSDPLAERAVEDARREVEQNPQNSLAWGRLGMVLYAHGFVSEALQCLRQAEQLDPTSQRWVYLQARLLLPQDP